MEFIINTSETVYMPAEDSYMLADNLKIKPGDSVLEIGTGTGIVAMYASKITDKKVSYLLIILLLLVAFQMFYKGVAGF